MRRSLLARAAYLLGRRGAQAEAKRERDDLVERFEAVNAATSAALRDLKNEIARMNAIDRAGESCVLVCRHRRGAWSGERAYEQSLIGVKELGWRSC
jgi:hypothetical protein